MAGPLSGVGEDCADAVPTAAANVSAAKAPTDANLTSVIVALDIWGSVTDEITANSYGLAGRAQKSHNLGFFAGLPRRPQA
jgi:hypothetical protein